MKKIDELKDVIKELANIPNNNTAKTEHELIVSIFSSLSSAVKKLDDIYRANEDESIHNLQFPTDFLKEEMDHFMNKFRDAKISLRYDRCARIFILDIKPSSIFRTQKFDEWKFELIKDFKYLYPKQKLMLKSYLYEILYETKGFNYDEKKGE